MGLIFGKFCAKLTTSHHRRSAVRAESHCGIVSQIWIHKVLRLAIISIILTLNSGKAKIGRFCWHSSGGSRKRSLHFGWICSNWAAHFEKGGNFCTYLCLTPRLVILLITIFHLVNPFNIISLVFVAIVVDDNIFVLDPMIGGISRNSASLLVNVCTSQRFPLLLSEFCHFYAIFSLILRNHIQICGLRFQVIPPVDYLPVWGGQTPTPTVRASPKQTNELAALSAPIFRICVHFGLFNIRGWIVFTSHILLTRHRWLSSTRTRHKIAYFFLEVVTFASRPPSSFICSTVLQKKLTLRYLTSFTGCCSHHVDTILGGARLSIVIALTMTICGWERRSVRIHCTQPKTAGLVTWMMPVCVLVVG